MRASIRTAVVNYLTAADFPYVGTVFAARPEVIDEEDYERAMAGAMSQYVTSPSGSSACLIVNIPSSRRTRKALTGRAYVSDFAVHEVVLELVLANTSGIAGGKPDIPGAQQDHDTICDALVISVRGDPLFAAPGVVWSAGEHAAGVDVQQSMPFTGADGLTVFIVTTVRLEVWEDIEGAAGAV